MFQNPDYLKFTIMSSREVRVEVRGLPEARHMMMNICEDMKRVRDLAARLRFLCDDIKKTDKIQIYRDKFLLPDNERINIIKT